MDAILMKTMLSNKQVGQQDLSTASLPWQALSF